MRDLTPKEKEDIGVFFTTKKRVEKANVELYKADKLTFINFFPTKGKRKYKYYIVPLKNKTVSPKEINSPTFNSLKKAQEWAENNQPKELQKHTIQLEKGLWNAFKTHCKDNKKDFINEINKLLTKHLNNTKEKEQ